MVACSNLRRIDIVAPTFGLHIFALHIFVLFIKTAPGGIRGLDRERRRLACHRLELWVYDARR
jgi:hypothetical protein